ncbi:hypothetical protein [Bacillus alveayuensis]|jgi:hypothetical protein|uniref:hypothetical protein n=1 Tax=Aeribacillus alveayuensis TaxID=279215 RepID=UPI0005D12092|nr:hypothetical protein [Bacillus alveayuensis]
MGIAKNTKTINVFSLLLVSIHLLILYSFVFMTEKLDTMFGQIGSLIALILGTYLCYKCFKIKSPFRYILLMTTGFVSILGALVLLIFLIACF